MKFGSHLYGTNTEGSDLDYKGVFLPTSKDVILNRIPKVINLSTNKTNVKNSPEDIDIELYSLHYFIKLACAGETVALDMVHAPPNMYESKPHPVWEYIVNNKEKLYTKNLKAFVGYARRQAAKYGIKGSRLNAAKAVLNILSNADSEDRVCSIWGELPTNEHLHMLSMNNNNVRQYQVCGRIIQETMKIGYAYDIINKFYTNYGHRAKRAANNDGIDWKAVSHALRAAFQVKELLVFNTITFPRPEAAFLKEVKLGNLDYKTIVGPKLDRIMEKVEALSELSDLPDKVDVKYWESFIVSSIQEYVL